MNRSGNEYPHLGITPTSPMLESLPKETLSNTVNRALLRRISAKMRGKTRLAKLLLSKSARNRTIVVRDRSCNTLLVPNALDPIGFYLWIDGVYEPETLQILEKHATPESIFVDIGANIGAFTVPMAKRT